MYRYAILVALVATMGTMTTMHNAKMGMKAAMDHCAGTLGSVHFEGGHMMVLATSGVNTELSSGSGGRQKVVFQNQLTRRTAVVTVDGNRGIVWVKNVYGKINSKIICILPD